MARSILDGIKNAIHEVLTPGYTAQQAEAEYLRTMYRDSGSTVVRRNTFYRLMNETGCLVGFEWNCTCGTTYPLLDANMWMRVHTCPVCKTEINLLKAVGATPEVPPAKWPELFAQLPMRPRLAGKPQSRFLDTWPSDKDADVGYEMADPASKGI